MTLRTFATVFVMIAIIMLDHQFLAVGSPEVHVANVPSDAPTSIVVHLQPETLGEVIHAAVLGINEGVLAPIVPSAALYATAGIRAVRYPGGSQSDMFDWKTGAICGSSKALPAGAMFDNFMKSVVEPDRIDAEITVNFGTSDQPACDAPGSPEVAADWVSFANNVRHYHIRWWEIGNEQWGSWEYDANRPPHDAAIYSERARQYYKMMKARDQTIQIGIPVSTYRHSDSSGNEWNTYLLSHASYDYVAVHPYTEQAGEENDTALLSQGPEKVESAIKYVRSQLSAAGRTETPISVSEWNSVYGRPGKQSVSIVNGLYAAEVLGTLLELGVRRAEFWNTFGCEYGGHGNYSDEVYGWQNFGSLGAFSEGVPFPTNASGCYRDRTQTVPSDTLFPTARAFQLLSASGFVTEGERMIAATVSQPSVRAFACTHGSGFDVLMVNLDPSVGAQLSLEVDAKNPINQMRWLTYGKDQYDLTAGSGPWVGPVSGSRRVDGEKINVTLPPWSMSVFALSK